jgi:nucleoside-diphosphate-sugar epimerase
MSATAPVRWEVLARLKTSIEKENSMNVDTKIVVLAGASGNLGSLIANALLDKPGVTLRALVRPDSRQKVAPLSERGAEIVEVDLQRSDGSEALSKALTGAFSVVSALQGGPDVIIDAQARLLEAAKRAGVRRFIPSDFSYNMFGVSDGENINTDMRRSFARQAEKARGSVEVVHIQNGCFLDRGVLFGFLGAIDLASGKAFLWGDGKAKMDFTTYEDTARFTAEAATDPGPVPAEFNVAGDTLDFHELVRAYEEASGKLLTVVQMGSLDDIAAEISRRQRAEPHNVFAYLPLMYWRGMLSGKGKLGPLVNARYPHLHPLTVREYVGREGL